MNKTLARIILGLLVLTVVGYFGFMSYISSKVSETRKKTWDAMSKNEFVCPDGTELRKDGWSKLGYSRTCVSLKHGKWEAWDNGYKNIDGYYNDGKKHGEWIWYRADGSVSTRITYMNGKEIVKEVDGK